jgi:protein gp37
MAETTGIEWCDSTFNPWIGCTKVGPGCDNCYAEAQDKRFGGAHWGVGAERKRTTPAYWRNLRKWNAKAADFWVEHRHKRRVFIASQADVFDNAVSDEWRADLWAEIGACPELEIIIVTKRVGNVWKMTPPAGCRRNVILLATVCNQAEADRDIPKLLDLKEKMVVSRVGLSIEPMLGPVDLCRVARSGNYSIDALGGWENDGGINWGSRQERCARLDWVICGGESGPNARPMHPDWARSLRDQCAAAGVPYFFKQWGEWAPTETPTTRGDRTVWPDGDPNGDANKSGGPGREMILVGKRRAGSLLDGREHKEVPSNG